MRVLERGQKIATDPNPNDSLDASERLVWNSAEGPMRLLRVDPAGTAEPPVFRLEGHPDDGMMFATLLFDEPPAAERARLYAACFHLGAFRPVDGDPAHHVPTPIAKAPARYLSSFLFGATSNSPDWVAQQLDINRETVYSHFSRVRSDVPELWPDPPDSE